MTAPPDATEPARRHWPWWAPWAVALAVAALVIGVGNWVVTTARDAGTGMGTGAMPPAVTGYYDGERIRFLHTEASDADVATMLTGMMGGSPVIHTPTLAQANEDMLAPVYVFTNGIQPDGPRGPFGFQPDVFPSTPGDPGYTPLRTVHLAAWRPQAQPRLLTSAEEIQRARRTGEIAVREPGIVVNMPVVSWPGGQR